MKKRIIAITLATPVFALAQAPGMAVPPQHIDQLHQVAIERLSKPVETQTTVQIKTAAPNMMMGAAPMMRVPGEQGDSASHAQEKHHRQLPVQVKVDVASRSGYFQTPMGNCSFRFAVGTSQVNGPVNVNCPAGRGTGSWAIEPDGKIHMHAKTADGHEYNFTL
jgi:hypothetical protein